MDVPELSVEHFTFTFQEIAYSAREYRIDDVTPAIEWPLTWNSWGLFGLAALIVCTAMAVFVLVTRPGRTQNRRLPLLLLLEGITTFGGPPGATFAASSVAAAVFFRLHFIALLLLVPVVLQFLATFETRFTRQLGTVAGIVAPWLVALAGTVLVAAKPHLFIQRLRHPPTGRGLWLSAVLIAFAQISFYQRFF